MALWAAASQSTKQAVPALTSAPCAGSCWTASPRSMCCISQRPKLHHLMGGGNCQCGEGSWLERSGWHRGRLAQGCRRPLLPLRQQVRGRARPERSFLLYTLKVLRAWLVREGLLCRWTSLPRTPACKSSGTMCASLIRVGHNLPLTPRGLGVSALSRR